MNKSESKYEAKYWNSSSADVATVDVFPVASAVYAGKQTSSCKLLIWRHINRQYERKKTCRFVVFVVTLWIAFWPVFTTLQRVPLNVTRLLELLGFTENDKNKTKHPQRPAVWLKRPHWCRRVTERQQPLKELVPTQNSISEGTALQRQKTTPRAASVSRDQETEATVSTQYNN